MFGTIVPEERREADREGAWEEVRDVTRGSDWTGECDDFCDNSVVVEWDLDNVGDGDVFLFFSSEPETK